MADFDSLVDDSSQTPMQPNAITQHMPFDDLQDDSEKYGTPVEQLKAGAEGAAQGLLGPAAPLLERSLNVNPEDIRGRAAANPITHGVGEIAGLGAGILSGTGQAGVMAKAGEAAEAMTGLGRASAVSKIGSEAVRQAAEMAVLQGSDEVSKRILQDPDASAQTAFTNVGLAAVMGGAFGGATGATGALWSATLGPKVEEALGTLRNHINGEGKVVLPEVVQNAVKDLGIEVDPAVQSMMSDDVRAKQYGSDLIRTEHPDIASGMQKMKTDATNAVTESIGTPIEDISHYDESDAGHEVMDSVKKEFDQKYGPIAEALDKRNAEAANIPVGDEARLAHYGKMLENGMQKWGTDSPLYPHYYEWGNRLLAKDTIGGIDQIKTELQGEINKAGRANDTNTMQALSDIRKGLSDFQEDGIENHFLTTQGSKAAAAQTLMERSTANNQYRQFRGIMDELSDHLGIGRPSGYKGLISKMAEKVTPEQLLNKFSPRGNADIIPFLQQHFPETLEKIRLNEAKRMIRPSVKMVDGEPSIDYKRLGKAIDAAKKGKEKLVDFAIPELAQKRIAAANALEQALPNPKNSGTPAGIMRLLRHIPTGAMGTIGWLMGHGPLGYGAGALIGHLSEKLSIDAPQAIKLAYLRTLASDAPIKAEGFKAAVDFMNSAYKGDKIISKAAESVFKPGASNVISMTSKLPDTASRTKLSSLVASTQQNPNDETNKDQGHLGHYLPQHQVATTATSLRAIQYLQTLKPGQHQGAPMDRPDQPTKMEQSRYNRALDIAHQPAIILQHVKDGTLQQSDLQDLNAMYPALAQVFVQKLTKEMGEARDRGDVIPYKTRLGVSLLMGQPIDSTMQPASIMAAQPIPKPPPPAPIKKSTSKLGNKTNNLYKTPNQAAETDRSSRD